MSFVRALRTNALTAFTRAHFEEPVVITSTVIGTLAVVGAPAALRHVLVDNAANYRRSALQRGALSAGLGVGLLTAEGEQWRLQRRVIGSFFSQRTVAGFAAATAAAAHSLVQGWANRADSGIPLDIAAELSRSSIDVLERTLFYDGIGAGRDEFPEALRRYLDAIVAFGPLFYALNFPRWVPWLARMRARQSVALFARTADVIVETRRRRLAEDPSSAPRDLVTALLQERDPKTGRGLSTTEMKENIFTLIVAGTDTTALAVVWSLYLLSLDPEWHARLQAEADRELPDGHFSEGSLPRLVATRAVIEEAMRLYPPFPVITRQAIEADRLVGLDVAPGTIVFIAPWVVHRHRQLWSEPDLFDPSRFLPGARDRIDRFAYIPFGAGARTCIGATFAMQTATIMLATIMRSFALEATPGHEVCPEHRGLLRPRGGMPMILRRRTAHGQAR